jgi:hypothetical protein
MKKDTFKVDFIIIGAQKCGTTYLASALSSHPEVCFSSVKEPFYFNKPEESGNLKEYHDLFSPEEGQICGEASTHYTFLPIYSNTATRIKKHNPNVKLIYIMRDPFKRMLSLYRFKRIRLETSEDFEYDVMHDPEYLHVSRYYTQLVPYLSLFDKRQIMPIVFEEFVENERKHLVEVARYLSIDEGYYKNEKLDFDKNESTDRGRPPSYIHFIRRVSRPFQHLVSSQIIDQVKKLFYKQDAAPSFSSDFKNKVKKSFEGDVDQIEKKVLGRKIDHWDE